MIHRALLACMTLGAAGLESQAAPSPVESSASCSPIRATSCVARPVTRPPFFEDHVPIVPIGPSRTMHTSLAMPPIPWLLTDGEAGTPACGRVAFNLARLSDERRYTDIHDDTFRFDGEEQIATLEVVSPRLHVGAFGRTVPFHLAGSLTAYSLHYALYAGFRNLVEETIGASDEGIRAAHTLTGRQLSITNGAGATTDLLDTTPLWKARLALKVPFEDVAFAGRCLSSAWSVGLTSPAFGGHATSGNDAIQVDTSLAWALPLSDRWRLTGAFNLALPGRTPALARRGIKHETLVAGGVLSAERWFSPSFAIALGATINGPYTRGESAPTDLASYYLSLGFLWRPNDRAEIHMLFSENPGQLIATQGAASTHYSFLTQRDADFSLTWGGSIDL